MTGHRYYITSLADWQRHAHRFAKSHWIALDGSTIAPAPQRARQGVPLLSVACSARLDAAMDDGDSVGKADEPSRDGAPGAIRIIVLIEADEGVHLALEDESAFEALPHPLAQKSISDAAQAALAAHGVAPGATAFDVTEIVARAHPLLRHRVF